MGCRRSAFRLVVLSSLVFMTATAMAQNSVVFTTEDYPPYNFRENGVDKGVGYEQVVMIMKDLSIPYTIEMMPWARAIAMAETEPMTCVFTAAHIPEREGRFKWVEPLAIDRNIIMSRKQSGIQVRNVEEARKYIVGTQRDDYTQALLERHAFPRIDLAANLDLTIKKLESGRIDLMPVSEKFYHKLVAEGHPLEQQFVLTEQKFAIACNKDMPDALIAQMQQALDRLIADGTQARLSREYGLLQPQ
ncbi:substrate-binding periplasmic protein [Agrobacterium vitis]|uniref:substrate-binding periplasmic protein n=1 Tax=Agrobacterium vitis TaxID=373 RepID=UPI0015DCBB82|nr:transporter substrate-binding domain-containing protein [Agrobacterium vitis]BCH54962.1 ABC transporter substrate-binding protein [Agrobacterium vitis]